MPEAGFQMHSYTIIGAVPNKQIRIVPFGDTHEDTSLFSEDAWSRFVERYKNDRDAYFIGMGDYQDCESTSERDETRKSDKHTQTRKKWESLLKKESERYVSKRIGWMKGRIIGLAEGHHFGELGGYQDGALYVRPRTTTQHMCDLLQCKYLDFKFGIWLNFLRERIDRPGMSQHIEIWGCHGHGASQLIGGSLNRVQRDGQSWDGDWYLQGHDHKRNIGTASRGYMVRPSLNGEPPYFVNRTQYYIRTGCFLRGFVPGEQSYPVAAGYNLNDLGNVEMQVTWIRKSVDGKDTNRLAVDACTRS